MNPQKEFVNAIMSVLRLEQNVYVTASIEEIIDRIDVKDYTIFIAYLGERNSDFERPIQTIAKAVDEFYEKKNKPTRMMLIQKMDAINTLFTNTDSHIKQEAHKAYMIEARKIDKDIDIPFGDSKVEKYIDVNDTTSLADRVKKAKSIKVYIGTSYGIPEYRQLEIGEIEPILSKLGGLDRLSELFHDEKIDFKKLIYNTLDISHYEKPNILEKIDSCANKEINTNVLSAINKITHIAVEHKEQTSTRGSN